MRYRESSGCVLVKNERIERETKNLRLNEEVKETVLMVADYITAMRKRAENWDSSTKNQCCTPGFFQFLKEKSVVDLRREKSVCSYCISLFFLVE